MNPIRNSQWHYPNPGPSGSTSGGNGIYFLHATQPDRWRHGPGFGGASSFSFCQAVNGQWEGNPEQFLRVTWATAPTQGDGHYQPLGIFRNTVLEHFINRARLFAGKQVTLSWQMRSPGGAPVGLVIWRSYTHHAMELFAQPLVNLPVGVVHRVDFTMDMPPIPIGYDVDTYSFLGVGVDLIGQSGPTIDFGPCQINEGGPRPFEERQYETEKMLALQPYP